MPVNIVCDNCSSLNHFNRVKCCNIRKKKKRGRPRGQCKKNDGGSVKQLSSEGSSQSENKNVKSEGAVSEHSFVVGKINSSDKCQCPSCGAGIIVVNVKNQ